MLSLAIAFAFRTASAQSVHLAGKVSERGSGEGIPGATLAILGTSRGAKANVEGRFRLELEQGKSYRIRVTAIGYKPDTLAIRLSQDSTMNIALAVAPVLGRTVTVSADASRTEARRIMHKVIDSKDAWQSQINDYRFQVYSRGNLRVGKDSGNNIAAIVESVADGYWKRGQGYAEKITARHQTADVPAEVNKVALFDVENFYNDRLQIEDYSIVSPVAHDAFDRYDYDLVGEGELNGTPVYKISVEPLNTLYPAFAGTLWIDQNDYTIVYLQLSPNDAVQLGPIKDIVVEQTFRFFDNKYWMPSEMNFACAIKLQMPIVPTLAISQTATLQDYIFNSGLPDTLFKNEKHAVAASADSVDSLHWVAMRTIPLARDEDTAYRIFDSLAVVFDSLTSHPAPASFSPTGLLFSMLSYDIYQYNRVEGSHFQLSHSWKLTHDLPLTLTGTVGYGIGDARWKYSVGMTQALTTRSENGVTFNLPIGGDVHFTSFSHPKAVSSTIGARIYHEYVRRSDAYDPIVNTLTALLLHSDYPNYYRARGFDVTYSLKPSRHFSAELKLTSEVETSLLNVTDYSLLLRRNDFRPNPSIDEGRLNELSASVNEDFQMGGWSNSDGVSASYAAKAAGGHFDYTTAGADISLEGKLGGWGKMNLSAEGNMLVSGALPPQALFFFDTRNEVIAPRTVFRTLSPFEFQGDRTAAVMLEQNFYDLPTRALGIKLPLDLYWFGFANVAWASLSSATANALPYPVQTLSSPFAEAGFGVGNILNVLRLDGTWRLTHRLAHNFFVTGTVGLSF